MEKRSGFYYSDVAEGKLKAIGKDTAKMDSLREELWKISLELTDCKNFLQN